MEQEQGLGPSRGSRHVGAARPAHQDDIVSGIPVFEDAVAKEMGSGGEVEVRETAAPVKLAQVGVGNAIAAPGTDLGDEQFEQAGANPTSPKAGVDAHATQDEDTVIGLDASEAGDGEPALCEDDSGFRTQEAPVAPLAAEGLDARPVRRFGAADDDDLLPGLR